MDCPRCTHALPEGSCFCPACGLDLAKVSEEAPPGERAAAEPEPYGEARESGEAAAVDDAETVEVAGEGVWPNWLQIHGTSAPKKPGLAATLGLFLGPFTYLYLEQMAWFWWGLLAGFCFIVWGIATMAAGSPGLGFIIWGVPVLGFMLHAYDVAKLLNARFQETGPREAELHGARRLEAHPAAPPDPTASRVRAESHQEGV